MTLVKTFLKTVITVGVLGTVLFGLTACGSKNEQSNEVNIGYFNNITHPQALLMKAEGSLEKSLGEDIKVNWTAFNAGPAEVEALFAGSIDIGYMGPVPAITANVKSKGDVQILSGATKGGAVLIKREGTDISSVADLKGKTVAIPQIGNTQHLNLLNLLSENNLKPVSEGGDVNVIAIANADVGNTMERGDIDAALVPEPWGATLLEQGAELVLDYDEIYLQGDYDVALVVVRKEFREEHPEIIEKFLEQHQLMSDKINNEKEQSLDVMNTELKEATGKALDTRILKEAFERIGVSTELNKASVSGFAQISKEQDVISEIPKEEQLYVSGDK